MHVRTVDEDDQGWVRVGDDSVRCVFVFLVSFLGVTDVLLSRAQMECSSSYSRLGSLAARGCVHEEPHRPLALAPFVRPNWRQRVLHPFLVELISIPNMVQRQHLLLHPHASSSHRTRSGRSRDHGYVRLRRESFGRSKCRRCTQRSLEAVHTRRRARSLVCARTDASSRRRSRLGGRKRDRSRSNEQGRQDFDDRLCYHIRGRRKLQCTSLPIRNANLRRQLQLSVSLASPITLHPLQTRQVVIHLAQNRALRHMSLSLNLTARHNVDASFVLSTPLLFRASPTSLSSPNPMLSTFITNSGTVTYALYTPPTSPHSCARVALLALHGAGVDPASSPSWTSSIGVRDKEWIVWPLGLTEWGYDWHGPSLQVSVGPRCAHRRGPRSSFGTTQDVLLAVQHLSHVEELWRKAWSLVPLLDPECSRDKKLIALGHSNGGQGALRLSHSTKKKSLIILIVQAHGTSCPTFPTLSLEECLPLACTFTLSHARRQLTDQQLTQCQDPRLRFVWSPCRPALSRPCVDRRKLPTAKDEQATLTCLSQILNAALSAYDNDLYTSNLAGVPILSRHGVSQLSSRLMTFANSMTFTGRRRQRAGTTLAANDFTH